MSQSSSQDLAYADSQRKVDAQMCCILIYLFIEDDQPRDDTCGAHVMMKVIWERIPTSDNHSEMESVVGWSGDHSLLILVFVIGR